MVYIVCLHIEINKLNMFKVTFKIIIIILIEKQCLFDDDCPPGFVCKYDLFEQQPFGSCKMVSILVRLTLIPMQHSYISMADNFQVKNCDSYLSSLCSKHRIRLNPPYGVKIPVRVSLTYLILTGKAPISLGCDEFAMGLRIDSPNRCKLSRNVRIVSQSPRTHRVLVANGSPNFLNM